MTVALLVTAAFSGCGSRACRGKEPARSYIHVLLISKRGFSTTGVISVCAQAQMKYVEAVMNNGFRTIVQEFEEEGPTSGGAAERTAKRLWAAGVKTGLGEAHR